MRSLRSVDPRGMYYGITIVVSFHPLFITKVDQAFHVKCFFEEASRGLTAELGVSMIPTTELEARHGIPGCTYSIHRSSIEDLDEGKAAGPPIQFARVGDRVLHQWHCNDKMFGILINNCYVTDGFGKKADVINEKGCPVDPILITGIRYSADLQRAYAESSVFKFADKPGVWFFCQIQMCMKKAGMCHGISPPSCATTAPPIEGGEGGRREKFLPRKNIRSMVKRPP
uniref:ZP domain-containing protein n=1 Tax=Haemonchus contortus TaxID=6289 RepID=A0A7I4XYV0_HAECO